MRIPERLDNKQLIKIIKKQIRLCLKYKHFRSLIFVSMRRKGNIVFEYLEYFCKNSWFAKRNIKLIKNNSSVIMVYFKNGSSIKVIPATEYEIRGNKATNVVIDTDITNRDIIFYRIEQTIIPLIVDPPKWISKLFGIKPYRKRFMKNVEYMVNI